LSEILADTERNEMSMNKKADKTEYEEAYAISTDNITSVRYQAKLQLAASMPSP